MHLRREGKKYVHTCIVHGLGEGAATVSTETATPAPPIVARGATPKLVTVAIHPVVMVAIHKAIAAPAIPSWGIWGEAATRSDEERKEGTHPPNTHTHTNLHCSKSQGKASKLRHLQ